MLQKKKIAEALEIIYRGTGSPVCAADSKLRLFWQSDSRAAELYSMLRIQLGVVRAAADVQFPPEDSVVLVHAEPPVVCKIQRLGTEEARYYILRFQPLPAERPLTLPEARAVMQSQVSAGKTAVVSVLQAANKLEEQLQSSGAEVSTAVLRMLHEACYTLLERDARCSELLWYETQETLPAAGKTICLSQQLEQFLSELCSAANGHLQIDAVDIPPALYTDTDPRRLQFVLLLLFAALQGGDPVRSRLSLSAEQKEDRIAVRMTVQGEADAEIPEGSPFRQTLVKDGTLLAGTALVQRFCETFDAEYLPEPPEAHAAACTLTLRAAECADAAPELHSPPVRYRGDRCTLTHVLLSSVLSASVYFPEQKPAGAKQPL